MRKNLIIILLILILPIFAYIVLDKTKGKDVIQVAQAGNKPMVMIFSSPMCSDCQKMKKVIVVVEPSYKDKIDFVKIDASSSEPNVQALIKKHNVYLVPTMVFLDKTGKQKFRTEGSMPRPDFESKLKAIL